jgi:[ribosomal protein S5]-alanine N-acetyltransferase
MNENRNPLKLKLLSVEDISGDYLSWMNDPDVTQFLEARWYSYTTERLKEYVNIVNKSQDNYLFGIFLDDKHIGNIKIGNVNIHKCADLGLLIGSKSEWGRGYGTLAIQLATDYAFNELNLNKLIACVYEENIASYKAFIKSGYTEVGRYKRHVLYKGKYIDVILLEKLKQNLSHQP